MGVAFIPSQYPFIPAQMIPAKAVSGRNGTLRWPGRTYKPTHYKGVLYLLGKETEPISTEEMLRRMTDIAAWLCGRDRRGRLILDAVPDRYYVAEVDSEALLTDNDWMNGQAAISFTCQPFARAIRESREMFDTAANTEKKATISVGGNAQTLLAFHVTNETSSVMNTMQIEAPDTAFVFAGLGLDAGETLHGSYTEDDLLRLAIEGVDGSRRSAMPMRQVSSDDDLLLCPGRNSVTVKTQTACSVILEARGRWM